MDWADSIQGLHRTLEHDRQSKCETYIIYHKFYMTTSLLLEHIQSSVAMHLCIFGPKGTIQIRYYYYYNAGKLF